MNIVQSVVRRIFRLGLAVIVLSTGLATGPVQADSEQDRAAGLFYEALAPYGTWLEHDNYGKVWTPNRVPGGWRPYTYGHWAYTEAYGWLWVSYWEWGWAPFHYGRWVLDEWYGWLWVPGTVWAPAWVFWRYGGGYAAWAPIPPYYVWNPYLNYYDDVDVYVPRYCWVGVRERDFPSRRQPSRLLAPTDNEAVLKATRPAHRMTLSDQNVVNWGVPKQRIEAAMGSKIETWESVVVTRSNPGKLVLKSNEAPVVFRPIDVKPSPETIAIEAEASKRRAQRLQFNRRDQVKPLDDLGSSDGLKPRSLPETETAPLPTRRNHATDGRKQRVFTDSSPSVQRIRRQQEALLQRQQQAEQHRMEQEETGRRMTIQYNQEIGRQLGVEQQQLEQEALRLQQEWSRDRQLDLQRQQWELQRRLVLPRDAMQSPPRSGYGVPMNEVQPTPGRTLSTESAEPSRSGSSGSSLKIGRGR